MASQKILIAKNDTGRTFQVTTHTPITTVTMAFRKCVGSKTQLSENRFVGLWTKVRAL